MSKTNKKMTITESDYINAVLKANREREIELHGRQVSMRGSVSHKSKKDYNRKEGKRVDFPNDGE